MQARPARHVGTAGLLALVATYGIGRQAFGLFVPVFREDLGAATDQIGLIASVAQLGYVLATVAAGVLTARAGPRRPIVLGCLVLAVGAATVAMASGVAMLAVGSFAAGASAGGTWGPFSDAVDAQVEPAGERRALALVNAGAPIGLVLAGGLVLVAGDQWRLAWWAFALTGIVAAAVNLHELTATPGRSRGWPQDPLHAFVGARSARLFTATALAAVTSGAYFAYAPDTTRAAGLPAWSGPAMWVLLGVAGGGVGMYAATLVDRFGMRATLRTTLALLAAGQLLLLAGGSLVVALASAAAFGVGFTVAFAVVVMWSQEVFADRPTDGFTVTIVCLALGFSLGPAAFGLLATSAGRAVALVVTALPAVLALLVPPTRGGTQAR